MTQYFTCSSQSYTLPDKSIKGNLIMYKGLVIARKPSPNQNEILMSFKDSQGETIEIKQTITDVCGGTVRMRIEAPDSVTIIRTELIE